jgi:hypothetical protein
MPYNVAISPVLYRGGSPDSERCLRPRWVVKNTNENNGFNAIVFILGKIRLVFKDIILTNYGWD